MTFQQFTLAFIWSGLICFGVYYLSAVVLIHKRLFDKRVYFITSCFAFSFYIISEIFLSMPLSEYEHLIFHKFKMIFAIINIPFLQMAIYYVFLPKGKRYIPMVYLCSAPLILVFTPFDIFTSLPVREVFVDFGFVSFMYHIGTTNIIYSIYAVMTFLVFLLSTVYYFFCPRNERRLGFFILNFFGIIVCLNEYLFAHNLIKSIMLADYFIFLFVALVFVEFLKEDRRAYIAVVELSKQLQKEKEEVIKASNLKSIFLANMSHELRTPMIGIQGFSKFLERVDDLNDAKEIGGLIAESSARLMDTLNLLIDYARIGAGDMKLKIEEIDLMEVGCSVFEKYKIQAAEKKINLKIVNGSSNYIINSDRYIIETILKNLIDNAVKFTFTGEIKLKIDRINKNGSEFATMEISDTGIGIAEENMNLIFDEFKQLSEGLGRNFDGTGLGLTLVKKYLELINGEISVKSKLGEGTVFTVKIPTEDISYGIN